MAHTITAQDFDGYFTRQILASGPALAVNCRKRLELVCEATSDASDLHLYYRVVRRYYGQDEDFDSTPRLATFASAFDVYNGL